MDTACAYAEAARLSITDLPDSEAKRASSGSPASLPPATASKIAITRSAFGQYG